MESASEMDGEIGLQQQFAWERESFYSGYGRILGMYQAKACLEHAVGKSLLDMPCGDGFVTRILAGGFSRVVGLDASEAHLAQAAEKLPAAEFHHGLIETFDTNERFDTITMINVLEHVVDPVAVLEKAASLMAPGGRLIAQVPNADAVNRRIAVLMGTLKTRGELSPFDVEVAGHRRSYNMETLAGDAEKAGLRITAKGGVFYKMLSTPQMDWLLSHGPWQGFGWGRIGEDGRDWKAEFCRACYEYGRERPEDCNCLYLCCERRE